MPVHASLWDSASITADSFKARLAIIHLVHEARGELMSFKLNVLFIIKTQGWM
jgi:uncharacterized ferritin-like protein (DUF455 family)